MGRFSALFMPGGVALAGIGWFGALHWAGFPGDGAVVQLDQKLAQWLFARRSPDVLQFFDRVSLLSSAKYIVLWALLISAVLGRAGQWRAVVALWLVPIAASLTTTALKLAFARPRPDFAAHVLSDFSFPSGHATGAVAFFCFLAWLAARGRWVSPVLAMALGVMVAVLVGLSRLYLGVHYLSDVLNGFLVGALWVLAGAWWLGRRDVKRLSSGNG